MTVIQVPYEIREGDPSAYEPLVDLELARIPRLRRPYAEFPFVNRDKSNYFHVRTAHVDGELAGWGFALQPDIFPSDFGLVYVVVAAAYGGRGIGRALYDELLATVPETVTIIGTGVDDEDLESKAIAEAHGFIVNQHGIDSEMDLVDLPEPADIDGITYEDVSDLVFPDEEAVEAMLRDSQTNPEAAVGIVSTLDSFRAFAADQDYIAVLARIDGAPAAIIAGDIEEDADGQRILFIHYTGVGQAFRGRNIGFALKQYAHRVAAERGATRSLTTNEEANAGIRHVNRKLGYRIIGGQYRLRRPRP